MALPPVIVGIYPDVPVFRGVPQLRRSPTAAQLRALAIATAAIRGRLWQSVASQPKWGIFNSANQPVLVADSVLNFDHRNEYRVSNFPVQQGAFASYNKVASPYEIVLRLVKSSDLEGRALFLQQLEAVSRTLDLYNIITPERIYEGVNMTRYEVTRRGSGGAYFLTEVDVFFCQIVQVAAQYSTSQAATRNAEQPNARPSVSQGIVQPQQLPSTVVWP